MKLICIGKIKESWIKEAVSEFEKRLTRYVKLEVIEMKDSTPQKEAVEINSKLKGVVYLLDETGIEYTSEQFAALLKKNQEQKDVTFVIGGPTGFAPELKQKYPKISLSKMTFTHEMARLFFTEQLYRGECILNNVPYHKK